jgi:hypothetical protein
LVVEAHMSNLNRNGRNIGAVLVSVNAPFSSSAERFGFRHRLRARLVSSHVMWDCGSRYSPWDEPGGSWRIAVFSNAMQQRRRRAVLEVLTRLASML